MLPAMIVVTGLLATAIIAASTVQSGVSAAAADRNSMVALHAAESGLAAGRHFLSNNLGWSPLVEPNNVNPQLPLLITGNTLLPGVAGNLFDAKMLAWYEVTILNNPSDPGLLAGTDDDTRVILRVTGHGPSSSLVVVEVEVTLIGAPGGPLGVFGWRQVN